MKEFKILTISHHDSLTPPMEHLQKFFNPLGVNFSVQNLQPGTPEEVPALVKQAGSFDAVRIDVDLSKPWATACPLKSLIVSQTGAADVFLFRNKRWEPELLLEKSITEVIVRKARTLDLNASAYAIGQGEILRVIGCVALGLGFRKILLVNEDDEADMTELKNNLEHMYVGSEVVPLPSHQLTLQTVGSSLMINGCDLTNFQELMADLSYFNFMAKDGLVMDLSRAPANRPMLEEARRAGLRTIDHRDTTGMSNWLFAQELGLTKLASIEDYLKSWGEFLGETVT